MTGFPFQTRLNTLNVFAYLVFLLTWFESIRRGFVIEIIVGLCVSSVILKTIPHVTITSTIASSTMDFNVAKIASSARIVTKSSMISLRVA